MRRGFAIVTLQPERTVFPSDPAVLFKTYEGAFNYAYDRLDNPYRFTPVLWVIPWWKKQWKIVEVHGLLE